MYLLISYPYLAPPHFPLTTGNHWFFLYVCEFVSVLLYSFIYFLDPTYKWWYRLFLSLCIYTPYLLYLLMGRRLGVVNNGSINIGLHAYFWIRIFFFFRYILTCGNARSYASSIFRLLRNSQNIFYSGCINLHFYQQCTRVPFSPDSCQLLFFVEILMMIILTDVK